MSGIAARLRESAAAFRAVFANGDLRRLELGWAGAIFAHWAYLVAVSVFAYQAGSASAVGLLILLRMIPGALVSPFMGALADRYPRERVLLVSSLSRAALVAGAAAGVFLDAPPAVIYVIAVLVGLLAAPFRPAQAALAPTLAKTPAELTAANVVASSIESLGFFVGPAVAGLLLSFASTGVVFVVTACSFLLSAFFVGGIRFAPRPERQPAEARAIAAEAFVGFRLVARNSRLRILVTLLGAQTLVAGALQVLVVVTAIRLLDLGKSGVGFLNSAFGVGALVGAVAAFSLVGLRRLGPPFAGGVVLWGAPLALIGIWPNTALALVLLGLVGIGNSFVDVAGFTLVQRAVPDEVLARVFGIVQMIWLGALGIGGLIAAPLVDSLGTRAALIAAGLFLPTLVLLLGPSLLRIDAAASAPEGELSLLRSIPIFAPLPGASLEHLAGRLLPVRLEPGTEVIREGDPGDRFYVVAEGEVSIARAGEEQARLGPGGYFGEIALLRDVPRTATVTAASRVTLYALEREDFLAAVSSHAPSAAAADQVVAARLPAAPVAGVAPATG